MAGLFAVALLLSVAHVSGFGVPRSNRPTLHTPQRTLEMKGKGGRVPIDQRGEYLKQERAMEARKQLNKANPEGVPVFQVYVRPKAGGLWIPAGDLAGDNRATSLVNAYMSGFLTETYKKQLDQGIARSIFAQEGQFTKVR